LPDALDEAGDLVQAIDVQQANEGWWFRSGWTVVISPACGEGDVTAIGQPDDEVRVSTASNPDDLDALTPQRVARVGYGHKSRRRWG
jgi:hypothetical protein